MLLNARLSAMIAAIAFALAGGGFVVVSLFSMEQIGFDVWNYRKNLDMLDQCHVEMERRSLESETVRSRLQIKILIAEQLIADRITLDEAAEQFEELNQVHPQIVTETRKVFPAENEHLSHALQAIGFADAQMTEEDPTLREQRMEELYIELGAIRQQQVATP